MVGRMSYLFYVWHIDIKSESITQQSVVKGVTSIAFNSSPVIPHAGVSESS